MDTLSITLALLVIVCWSLNTVIKKKTTTFLTPHESIVLTQFISTFVYVIIFLYLVFVIESEHISFERMSKISLKDLGWVSLGALVTVLGGIFLIVLVSRAEINQVMTICQPGTIVLGVILGMLFFSEELSYKKVAGISLVCLGIALVMTHDSSK